MKCTYVIRLMQHQFHITQTKLKTYTNCTFCIVPTGLMSYMYVKPGYLPPPPRGPPRAVPWLYVPWPWLFVLAMAICAWPWLFVPCRGYLSLLAKSIKIGLLVSFFELKQSLCCSIPIHLS